jgi:hypothetical protein
MPLEILVMKPAKTTSGLFTNNSPDSFTFKSQSYFSMPVMTALMPELCQMNILNDSTSTDLDLLISYYTPNGFEPSGDIDSHKDKYDYLMSVRHENNMLQEELFKAYTTAILQCMPDQEEGSPESPWDEHVSAVLFRTFSHLLVQSMLAYSWH